MRQLTKEKLKTLWGLKHLTVDEFLAAIAAHPDLKFLITTAGLWFLIRNLLGLWIGAHVIYLVYRIFHFVLA